MVVRIQLKKLFFVTVALKVSSTFLGWWLQRTWSLGFAVPLAIMVAYIALGFRRRDDDVSDEKFADTCYYLGFIFTITSIIFSLFDLPNIGTRIQDIAVRFGAAMVSTVLGLAVRVYLVSFRKDGTDAIEHIEDAVVIAANRFREQMVLATERLEMFQGQVDKAASATVERVNMQIEKLTSDYSERLATLFSELAQQNQAAFSAALQHVTNASLQLSQSFERYSVGIQGNLTGIEQKVTLFADAVTDRLKSTTFPDDYFKVHLEEPVRLLREASGNVAEEIRATASEVSKSTSAISAALTKLNTKTAVMEHSMEAVLRLAQTQQAVLSESEGQIQTLDALSKSIASLEPVLVGVTQALGANTENAKQVGDHFRTLSTDTGKLRDDLEKTLAALSAQVAESRQENADLMARIQSTAKASEALAIQVNAAATSNIDIAVRLQALARAPAPPLPRPDVAPPQLGTPTSSTAGTAASPGLQPPAARTPSLMDTMSSALGFGPVREVPRPPPEGNRAPDVDGRG